MSNQDDYDSDIDPSSDPNLMQQAGSFISDAAVDTAVDGFVNRGMDAVISRVPGTQGFEPMLNTEVDQVVNNEINAELNKGVDGIINDVEGLFGQRG